MTTTVPTPQSPPPARPDEPVPEVPTSLKVNGRSVDLEVDPRRSLSDVLRREVGLTGTTVGCEQGSCGTCTVLLAGVPVRSCIVLAAQATGREVETVESLGAEGRLSRLQEQFRQHGALQCGFCTAGFLMLATELLRRNPHPSRAEVVREMAANLCRCTGYEPIVDAVLATAGAAPEQAAGA